MRTKRYSYYKTDKILSLNATYNFILGARGLGKTFGFKEYVIRKAIKTGEQFIYLRRFKPELKGRSQFFADIAYKFPSYDFRVEGPRAQMAHVKTRDDKKRQWQTIGFFIALSVAQNEKSVPYPMVTTILFDEFIIEKGAIHYLPDEAFVFNNFYSTVDRGQDKTRVIFMANTVSITNPYFIQYKIRPDEHGELFRSHGGFIACHFPDSADFKNEIYESKFGKFIKDTEFADFAFEAQFADGHTSLVAKKPEDARYLYTLEVSQGIITLWSYTGGYYHCQQKRPVSGEMFFTFRADLMSEDKILAQRNDVLIQKLRTAFRHSRMTFDSPETRNIFLDVFKK